MGKRGGRAGLPTCPPATTLHCGRGQCVDTGGQRSTKWNIDEQGLGQALIPGPSGS